LAAARASWCGKATSKRPGRAPVSPAACTQSGRGSPEPARAALTLLPALAVAGGVSSGQAGCSAHLCAVKELVVQQTHQAPAHVSAHAVGCMRSSTPWRPVAGPEQLLFAATRSWQSRNARLSHAAMSREEEMARPAMPLQCCWAVVTKPWNCWADSAAAGLLYNVAARCAAWLLRACVRRQGAPRSVQSCTAASVPRHQRAPAAEPATSGRVLACQVRSAPRQAPAEPRA